MWLDLTESIFLDLRYLRFSEGIAFSFLFLFSVEFYYFCFLLFLSWLVYTYVRTDLRTQA